MQNAKKYDNLHWNGKECKLAGCSQSALKQANKKMGFHNRSVFTLVFDEPADESSPKIAKSKMHCNKKHIALGKT